MEKEEESRVRILGVYKYLYNRSREWNQELQKHYGISSEGVYCLDLRV